MVTLVIIKVGICHTHQSIDVYSFPYSLSKKNVYGLPYFKSCRFFLLLLNRDQQCFFMPYFIEDVWEVTCHWKNLIGLCTRPIYLLKYGCKICWNHMFFKCLLSWILINVCTLHFFFWNSTLQIYLLKLARLGHRPIYLIIEIVRPIYM